MIKNLKMISASILMVILLSSCAFWWLRGVLSKPGLWDGKMSQSDYAKKYGIEGAEIEISLNGSETIKLALVPAAEYTMGDNKETRDGYKRKVMITKPYFMSIYEVTQGQYESVVGTNPSIRIKDKNCPVVNVSWHDALDFCQKVSAKAGVVMRLPTEAEWELACRAGTVTSYYWGDSKTKMDDHVWHSDNCSNIMPVGRKLPNQFGLYDMIGNVSEWCRDDAGVSYETSEGIDPVVENGCKYKTCRGACRFASGDPFGNFYTSYIRRQNPADRKDESVGFRVVVEYMEGLK